MVAKVPEDIPKNSLNAGNIFFLITNIPAINICYEITCNNVTNKYVHLIVVLRSRWYC